MAQFKISRQLKQSLFKRTLTKVSYHQKNKVGYRMERSNSKITKYK